MMKDLTEMNLPTIEEINPTGDPLDGQSAVLDFHGKSLGEAQKLFERNGLYYSGNFYWIGPIAFLFYFKAALAYLQSDESKNDSDFVNSMVGVLELRLTGEYNDYDALKSGVPDFLLFCKHTLENYSDYDLDPVIYEYLRLQLRRLVDFLDV